MYLSLGYRGDGREQTFRLGPGTLDMWLLKILALEPSTLSPSASD
jgi:hypothetical protein